MHILWAHGYMRRGELNRDISCQQIIQNETANCHKTEIPQHSAYIKNISTQDAYILAHNTASAGLTDLAVTKSLPCKLIAGAAGPSDAETSYAPGPGTRVSRTGARCDVLNENLGAVAWSAFNCSKHTRGHPWTSINTAGYLTFGPIELF